MTGTKVFTYLLKLFPLSTFFFLSFLLFFLFLLWCLFLSFFGELLFNLRMEYLQLFLPNAGTGKWKKVHCKKYRNFTWFPDVEILRKGIVSAEFPHQEFRWNYGIFRSGCCNVLTTPLQSLHQRYFKYWFLLGSSLSGPLFKVDKNDPKNFLVKNLQGILSKKINVATISQKLIKKKMWYVIYYSKFQSCNSCLMQIVKSWY